MNGWKCSIFAVLALALTAQATIRTVNGNGTGQYLHIYLAVNAAVTGDTILVAPGTYNNFSDNPNINNKRLHIIGAGWDHVNAQSFATQSVGANHTVIEGINSSGQWSLGSSADSLILRRCRIRGSSNNVVFFNAKNLTVEDCILTHNTGNGIIFEYNSTLPDILLAFSNCLFSTSGTPISSGIVLGSSTSSTFGTVLVRNCVFSNIRQPFYFTNSSTLKTLAVVNSIFYDWGGTSRNWGTYGPATVFEYNASDSTAPAIPGFFTNQVLLNGNDPFVNYDETANYVHGTSDLHLNANTGGLLLVDAGHPDSSFNDLDGSRNDIGLYGGPRPLVDNGVPGYPFAISLTLSTPLINGEPLEAQSVGRIGPRY
ncbi:MAG: right-handed parallel beta-helix repeat-containing protein [Calditrichaeota bacterium]|nr:right-handed parallel beta-helix repeat-containing protein [Calditrichota bacterium]MCB9391026.1 right-handed parallel beta-helix repeat-containing protein [Calditrichota bacterium]